MFQDIFNFKKVRTRKQAVGFYLFYLLLIVLIAMTGGVLSGLISQTGESFEEAFDQGAKIGTFLAIVCCVCLTSIVVWKKKLISPLPILLIPISGLLAALVGGLLGLIPAAYLTTITKSKK